MHKKSHRNKLYHYSRTNLSFFFSSKSISLVASIVARDRKIREFSVSNSFKINPLSSSSSSSSSNSSSSSSSSEEASAHENEEASDNENEEGSDNESGYSSDANRSAVSEGRDEIAISHMPASEVPEDVLPRFIRDTKFISDEAMDDEDVGPF